MELEATCDALEKALKGKGDTLTNLVLSLSKRDRYEVRKAYKSLYGKELIEDINSAKSGNYRRVIVDLFRTPEERDTIYLYKAMKGAGTDEETLIEIICSRSNVELQKIIKEYKTLYNEDLEKKISTDTSGDLKKILVSLLQCKRSENSTPNDAECKKIAEILYKAGEGKIGTDEQTFNKVFALSSPPELFSINNFYSELSSKSLKEAVSKEFSGNIKKALKTILESTISPANYYAKRVNKAVKGLGTKDKMLIRNVVSREGIDMKEIRNSYQTLFGKDMVKDIKGDTSGDYQKILMLIASGD
jgi:annexin A7/11